MKSCKIATKQMIKGCPEGKLVTEIDCDVKIQDKQEFIYLLALLYSQMIVNLCQLSYI